MLLPPGFPPAILSIPGQNSFELFKFSDVYNMSLGMSGKSNYSEPELEGMGFLTH